MPLPLPRATVLRPLSSAVSFWALAALATFFVGDALLRGAVPLALRSAGVFALVLWLAWSFLFRMSVRIEDGGVTAVNWLRRTYVPWSRIVGFERRAQIRIVLDRADDSGREWVDCWGSPFPLRSGSRAVREARRTGEGDAALHALELARGAARGGAGEVRREWDLAVIVAGGCALLCAAAALLVP